MRQTFWLPALLACTLDAAPVDAAAILYNLTNLGSSGYQFQTGADGLTYGVTSGATGVTYAFEKAPTTAISQYVAGAGQSPEYSTLTLQDGAYKVGYSVDTNLSDPANKAAGGDYFKYPTFESPTSSWIGGSDAVPMIADMNKLGQVVGASVREGTNINDTSNYYAAFSAPGLQPHGGQALLVDNLNNYIAAQPGMSLFTANAIDDLGRIIAVGTGGIYLLTPVALGEAATVPEPTVLATLALGSVALPARARWRASRGVRHIN